MESFKEQESQYPRFQVNVKNFLTTPTPNLSHYLKCYPTGKFKAGKKSFPWQSLLKKGTEASFRFNEESFDLSNEEIADFFENINKTLIEAQVNVVVRDYIEQSDRDYYQPAQKKGPKRIPGFFECTLVFGNTVE
jgi:hypothetical protein